MLKIHGLEYIQSKARPGLERVEKNVQSQVVCKVSSGAGIQREAEARGGEFLELTAR